MAVGIPHTGNWANRPAHVKMRAADGRPAERWQGSGPPRRLRRRTPSPRLAWQAIPRRPTDAGWASWLTS
jgi:hypothetical protein